jgi:hypothetical protein
LVRLRKNDKRIRDSNGIEESSLQGKGKRNVCCVFQKRVKTAECRIKSKESLRTKQAFHEFHLVLMSYTRGMVVDVQKGLESKEK